jgi:hypothetical protein
MNPDHSPILRVMTSGNFLTGLVVGGLTTFVLTQPGVQRALFRTAAKTASLITAGVAEAKERFHDAEAEVQQEAEAEDEDSGQTAGAAS